MSLSDALGDPGYVSALLLLEFDVRVEHAEVKLVHEGLLHQKYLKRRRIFYNIFCFQRELYPDLLADKCAVRTLKEYIWAWSNYNVVVFANKLSKIKSDIDLTSLYINKNKTASNLLFEEFVFDRFLSRILSKVVKHDAILLQ